MNIDYYDGHDLNDANYSTLLMLEGYGLPEVKAVTSERVGYHPLISGVRRMGRQLFLNILITATSSIDTYRKQLNQWFDPDDETPKVLRGNNGSNNFYVNAICERLTPVNAANLEFVATLRIDDDIFWREYVASTTSWSITATGQTKVVTNAGEMDAYPVYTLTPTSGKSTDYGKKRFITVKWRADEVATKYPVNITNALFNTSAEVSGGDMQADGDDLRVFVDGAEVGRWLYNMNTTTTSVWVNLDWEANIDLSLSVAIGTGDTDLYVYEDITNMPTSGILMIDNEIITYTSKDNTLKRFSNCTRGAKGTTAATHSIAATTFWLQHDIWILYSNSSATAPSYTNESPAFTLSTSSNTSWDYDDFGDNAGLRAAKWVWQVLGGSPTKGTANHVTSADPWQEIGFIMPAGNCGAAWYLENPCGITAANFQNGEYNVADSTKQFGHIWANDGGGSGGWSKEYDIPFTNTAGGWVAWSRNETLDTGSVGVMLQSQNTASLLPFYWECADVTLTLNSSNTPITLVGAEQGNYTINGRLTNTTTGLAIDIYASGLDLNEDVEIDTKNKTVTYLADNSNLFGALTLIGGIRRDWLAIQVGSNTFRWDETGVAGMTVVFDWEERVYQ